MINLTREEAQNVLNLLILWLDEQEEPDTETAIETLRAKLSAPEPEPVAWTVGGLITDFSRDFSAYKTKTYTQPLYTTPPQRKPEPKPVAWLNKLGNGAWIADVLKCEGDEPSEPLYTAPPQREWIGLTQEEVGMLTMLVQTMGGISTLGMYRILEKALKEKNNG